ncbi:MAG: hypothetical protein GYB31_04640 [Bacteroidetes bacterium]|nr:hypothetical protein [Bacteroidota bacterium]
MKQYLSLSLILFLTLLLSSCSSEPKTHISFNPESTYDAEIQKGGMSMKLPITFKRSSRYTIKKDMPGLAEDPDLLYATQRTLEGLEFNDGEIDLFIDTVSYAVFFIQSLDRTPLSQQDAKILNSMLAQEYRNNEATIPGYSAEKVVANLKGDEKKQVMKIKYKVVDPGYDFVEYRTSYFLTTPQRSLYILESSSLEEDMEPFVWSIKE